VNLNKEGTNNRPEYSKTLALLKQAVDLVIHKSLLPETSCTFPSCDIPPPNCQVVNDAKGCPTCNYICRYGQRVCPEIRCGNTCAEGLYLFYYMKFPPAECIFHNVSVRYAMDRKGCQTCYCKVPLYQPPPAPPPSFGCPRMCPAGTCPNSCVCQPYCNSSGTQARFVSEPEEPNEM
ncbi:unnamed protein product, partial [Candidula unifasciata]